MLTKIRTPRNEQINIRYSKEEFDQLKMHFARSNTRTLNSYIRKVSLHEPVELVVRNGSFDSFIDEMIVLRKEMTAIRQKTSFSTQQQDRLIRIHEEIRLLLNKIAELCMPK